ncbi:hypothetical protein QBC34DRAFT_378385 [Podospora aff. communis PSN243]|uniref:Uncharacterized protein n=1 Tax=Podospora aff. communis PSN243 TaxID=3040156 RepID=A0AAV9GRS8_9PEZI|nr:hypothetical protein QBC34DRAFT_378385 [Podospora aff. communis PSN243]
MSSQARNLIDPFRLPGFVDLQAPRSKKLVDVLLSPTRFSPEAASTREALVSFTTVVFRLIIWHRDIRAHRKFHNLMLKSLGLQIDEGAHELKTQLNRWWGSLVTCRDKYIELIGDANHIPAAASGAEKRLLRLIDTLRTDIAQKGIHPRASTFALDGSRINDRIRAWRSLLEENPSALVVRDPVIERISGGATDRIDEATSSDEDAPGAQHVVLPIRSSRRLRGLAPEPAQRMDVDASLARAAQGIEMAADGLVDALHAANRRGQIARAQEALRLLTELRRVMGGLN